MLNTTKTSPPHQVTALAVIAPTEADALARLFAQFARDLGYMLMANAQNTASLNFNAARALLAHARIPGPGGSEMHSEQWRASWRSFEVCATSADQILNLARHHADRTIAGLRRSSERVLDEIESSRAEWQAGQAQALRAAFDALQQAQLTYWQQAQQALAALVQLAQSPTKEPPHGAH